MWLWPLWVELGFGEPWSVGCSCLLGGALPADVRLPGWVGRLKSGVEPREKPAPLPLFRRSQCFGPIAPREDSCPLPCVQNYFIAFRIRPLRVALLPPAVSRCWSSFFLSLCLLNTDPKAPLPLASVVLVLELK